MLEQLTPIILTVVVALVTWGARALSARSWARDAEDAFFLELVGMAQRVKDKIIDEMKAAKAADSDGGAEITPAEWSTIRQRAFEMLMANLSGPALKYAKEKGEPLVKGWLSSAIQKVIGKKDPPMLKGISLPKATTYGSGAAGSGAIGLEGGQ